LSRKVEFDIEAAQGRTDIDRDLQQARNEVERLTLERDFSLMPSWNSWSTIGLD
jgi:hypothetical protein